MIPFRSEVQGPIFINKSEVVAANGGVWKSLTYPEKKRLVIEILEKRGDQRSIEVADRIATNHPQFGNFKINIDT